MYIPKKYGKYSWKDSKALIEKYPLATIVAVDASGKIVAGNFPFFLYENLESGKKYLQAHVARANPLVPIFDTGKEILVVFMTHDSYIAPIYYPGKQETHKFVPTWDFGTVHIHGTPRLVNDSAFILKQLNKLTNQQESVREDPWQVSDAPEAYVNVMMKAIIGLEVEITEVECKYKFEQGMSKRDIEGAIKGLKEDGKPEVAAYIQEESLN